MRDVLHVVRELVDELVHLVDQRRDEREPDRDEEGEREEVRERGGGDASLDPVTLEPADRGVQRQGQEDRDHHPGEDVPGDPDDLEDDRDGDDRPQQGQDRPQLEPDDSLRDHRASITRGVGRPGAKSGV